MGKTSSIDKVPIAEHELEIGRMTFYPNIIVGEVGEGMHITFESATIAAQVIAQTYKGTIPFVYISNRVNSYSMDPVAYKELFSLVPNLLGFAVVSESKRRRMLSNLERMFVKKPMRVFSSMDEAFDWAHKLLESKN
jgi:flavin-dependent dehydrogenase